MASNYPGSLDSFDTIASDKKTSDAVGGRTHRAMHNDLGDAIEAVQSELGTNPSGSDAWVAARLAAIEATTILATGALGPIKSPLRSMAAANEAPWREALRRVRRGGKARVVCVGTSNTFGWGTADPHTVNYPALMARNLEGLLGVRVGWGLELTNKFTIDTGDSTPWTRPWFTLGDWNMAGTGYTFEAGTVEGEPGQADGPTFTYDVRDGFAFLYVDRTAGRTFQYKVDGGAATTVTTTGTNQILEQVVPVGSPGVHTLSFHNPVNGTAILYAVGEYVDSGIEVCNWGIPGLETWMLWHNMPPQWFGSLFALAGADPDLILIEAGVNDTDAAAVFTGYITDVVTWLQANTSATIVLIESYGTNGPTFAPAARAVAESLDIHSLSWLDVMQGDRDPWRASEEDPSHMSREGYEVLAQGMTRYALGDYPLKPF